ncbi:MAG: Veg family protein [Tissierellaceae bacterium]
MGCFIEKDILTRIRKDIEKYIGKNVILRANKGRKKTIVREGILEAAYPNIFIVSIINEYDSSRKVSYTYTDVLTGTVEVTVSSQAQTEVKIS